MKYYFPRIGVSPLTYTYCGNSIVLVNLPARTGVSSLAYSHLSPAPKLEMWGHNHLVACHNVDSNTTRKKNTTHCNTRNRTIEQSQSPRRTSWSQVLNPAVLVTPPLRVNNFCGTVSAQCGRSNLADPQTVNSKLLVYPNSGRTWTMHY
jgi:hypothetical protein